VRIHGEGTYATQKLQFERLSQQPFLLGCHNDKSQLVNVEHDQLFPKWYHGTFQTSKTISSNIHARKLQTSRTVCSEVSIGTPSTPFEGTLVRAYMESDELPINLQTLELGDESRT
jgi:hypothetical protein